jgi:hypothetical protein
MTATQSILNNATITTSGSDIFYPDGSQIILLWNIQNPITGSLPTIQFKISEVDPIDLSTVVGATATSPIINAPSISQIQMLIGHSPTILVQWTVSGASASFGDVNLTISSFAIPSIASTTTDTLVSVSTSSTTLLASNSARLGASIYNNSQANLFIKLGSTATTDSYTVKMVPNAYYELPYSYTGRIDGIWDSSVSGDAQITEFSA